MTIPDFTTIVAIDNQHLAEWKLSYPSWLRCPHIAKSPLLILRHPEVQDADWLPLAESHPGQFVSVEVPIIGDHRETMLSAFVLTAPSMATTPYYLKVDTDALFHGGDWINPAWFIASPVMIAPQWSYSKPASTYDQLDLWAATVPDLLAHAPPAREKLADRVKSRRIISYVQFGRTDWTRQVAGWCGDRLPVPSQDSLLSYCAERGGFDYCRVRLPQWRHIGRGGERLAEAAREAMAA